MFYIGHSPHLYIDLKIISIFEQPIQWSRCHKPWLHEAVFCHSGQAIP